MKIKRGASIQGLDFRMRTALITADKVWKGLGQELVITSGLEGNHSAGSLHYYGLAVDMRINYFNVSQKRQAHKELANLLIVKFDVVLEVDHIHVEYRL